MPTSLDDLDLRVYLDYPQDRRNRLGPYLIATDGSHLDDSTAVDCIIDPVTQSVLGMPLPMTPEWKTTATGDYVRLQKSDYTFSSPATSSDWLDFDFRLAGDTYLISASSDTAKKSASVKVTGGFKKNQPIFLSYSKIDKAEQNNQYILKLFWQSTVEFPNYDVGLFFKSDGGADLHRGYVIKSTTITWSTGSTTVTGVGTKFNTAISSGGDGLQANSKLYTVDGQLIGTVSTIASDTSLTLTSNPKFAGTAQNWFPVKTTADKMKMIKSYSRTEQNFNANKTLKPLGTPNGKFNDVFIIPCRGKELLVFSSYGLNFSHSFDDLEDPYSPPKVYSTFKSSPVILPKCDFGVVVPTGNVAFQLAKLKFKDDWNISSKPIEFDNSYLPNSQVAMFWDRGDDVQDPLTIWDINYPGTKIKKTSGPNFDTSWPTGSRLYLVAGLIEDVSYSGLIGKISSITSSEITLDANSKYYSNYSPLIGGFKPLLVICNKKNGTVTFSTNSNTVTGTNTLFNTQVGVGKVLFDDNDRIIGQVKSVTNDTVLQLHDNPCFSSTDVVYWQNLPVRKFLDRGFSFEQSGPADNTSEGFAWVWDYQDKNGVSILNNLQNYTSKEIILNIRNLSAVGSNKFDTDFLYSSDEFAIFNAETLNNTSIDITSAVERLTIGRNQDGAMTGSLSARKKLLSDLSVLKPEILSNRSIKVTLKPRTAGYSEITIFEGFLSEPDIEYIQGSNYDNYALLNFELTDKKQQMNEIFFSIAPSFEDKPIPYIFDRASELASISGKDYYGLFSLPLTDQRVDKNLLTYSFDFNRNNSSGQYNSTTTPNLGDSVGSWLENLRNELFSNYKISIKNKWIFDYYKIEWLNLPNLSIEYNYARKSNSDLTLYLNETSANTYGSIPINKAYKRTIRSMSRTYQRPDANKVTVIGIDKNNNNRITVTKTNTNSINPYITPSNRGNDWMGDTRDFVQISPSLSSLKSVEFAADGYFDRLSKCREIIQFNSDLLTLFDTTSSYPNPDYWKTGVIFYNTSTSTVTGNPLTRFEKELAVNDKLYANGTTLVGTVNSITDDDTLVLTANSAVSGETVKWTNKILSGTIDTLNYSTGVTGFGTAFNTELAVNDFLYHPSTGELIGKVQSIASNTSLTLYANATISLTNNLFTKTKPYLFLEQFKFLDNADVVTIKDTSNNTIGNYIINSWNCEFVKDYTSASADEIIIRNCNYQVQKTDLIENVPVISISEYNEEVDNIYNVFVGENTTVSLIFDCEKYITASLAVAPSGMTVSYEDERINEKTRTHKIELQWTPSSTQQNYIHNVELQLTPTGQSAVSFYYKFRVFSA